MQSVSIVCLFMPLATLSGLLLLPSASAQSPAKPPQNNSAGAKEVPLSPAAQAVRKVVQPVYDMLAAAVEKADPEIILSVMNANYTPDYEIIDQDGQKSNLSIAKYKAVDAATTDRNSVRDVKVRSTILDLRLQGDEAVITVRNLLTALGVAKKDTKPVRLESSGVKQDTWRKTDKGWRLVRTRFQSSEYRIDGKLVPQI